MRCCASPGPTVADSGNDAAPLRVPHGQIAGVAHWMIYRVTVGVHHSLVHEVRAGGDFGKPVATPEEWVCVPDVCTLGNGPALSVAPCYFSVGGACAAFGRRLTTCGHFHMDGTCCAAAWL